MSCNGRPGVVSHNDAADGDKAVIRAWLRKRLDDPDIEEVRWWGPVKSEDIKTRRIAALEKQAEDWRRQVQENPKLGSEDSLYSESDLDAIKAMKDAGAFITYRLRYRQKSKGAPELIDSAFIVHSKQVQEFPMCSDTYPMGWVLLDPRVWFIEEQLRETRPDAVPDPSAIRNEARRMCER